MGVQRTIGEPLTRRQTEFLALAAQGMKSSQIAAHCFVTEEHVWATLQDARQRIGARNNEQALALAIDIGMIVIEAGVAVPAVYKP